MSQSNARNLLVLDRIYRFVGDKTAPNRFETSVPVQFVHDVSRAAELGAAAGRYGGWFLLDLDLDNSGSGTEQLAVDPYVQALALDPKFVERREIDVYLYELGVIGQNATNQTNLEVALIGDSSDAIPEGSNLGKLLFAYSSATGNTATVTDFAGTGTEVLLLDDAAWGPRFRSPLYIPPGSRFTVRSVSGAIGANNCDIQALCWAGVRGTSAP